MVDLVQIAPNYPPIVCGVGDHAAQMVPEFERLGAQLYTVVANEHPISEAGKSLNGVRSAQALTDALHGSGAEAVIAHFSGYGYARNGLCVWLVEGLNSWKDERPQGRIVTIFHEVYATGPIWRRSFWTSRPQRRIARDLARISDRCFVSSAVGAAQLHKIGAPGVCEVLPVFSNVGEPAEVAPLFDRPPQAVVFGGRGQRRRVYEALKRHPRQTEKLLSDLKIDRILDIGPDLQVADRIARRPVEALGVLPADRVSETLLASRLGLLDYPGNRLTKSGILAAYLAHGVFAFNLGDDAALAGGADAPPHNAGFVSLDSIAAQGPTTAAAGHAWYRKHGVAVVARRLFEAAGTGTLPTTGAHRAPDSDA
ncbi:hypothetical protein [Rhodovulum marinum]|uniref:Glycosyltransferase involved in cell wall biosynthesis n=1 Tax=Rhodovulum marinum TaxID=320662 RepID=A0A4R2PYE8_9RHOB|nr:hypothetical protein [Rhodovulum marinum]TCP39295.1 hypothetical protein EV662_11372 [Rhodovulum marinum]